MTFRQRILLDRLLAVPLSVALNGLVRLLGILLHRDHSVSPEQTKRIVVCKLVGMGSLIQGTPLLRGLRQHFPQARITVLTLHGNRDLAERLEGVDEVLCLDDRGLFAMLLTTCGALRTMISRKVDHYFDLEVYSGFATLLSIFSLARNRFGFYRHSNRFKRGIYTHLVYFNTRMPVRLLYLQLGRVTGIPEGTDTQIGRIRVGPAEVEGVCAKLEGLGLPRGEPYVALNPNASDLLIERRWPVEHVIRAIELLREAGSKIVLMGARAEADYVGAILARIPETSRPGIFDTSGQLSLGELCALVDRAACVLTNDTGPMHIAFAMHAPTVCLMGPVDPVHYGMEQPDVVTFYAHVSCSPCVHEVDEPPCRGNNVCMQRIDPKLVVGQVLRLIRAREMGGPPASETIRLPLQWTGPTGTPLGIVMRGGTDFRKMYDEESPAPTPEANRPPEEGEE